MFSLGQYFALENSEFSIIETPGGSKSYRLWEIDVSVSTSAILPFCLKVEFKENELAKLDHGQVLQTLVPLTQSQNQVRYLVSLSLQHSHEDHVTTYVSLLCSKIVELKEFDLLLSYRMGLPSEISLDLEVMSLLAASQELC